MPSTADTRVALDFHVRPGVDDGPATLEQSLRWWRELGWPADALRPPTAGFKYMFRPPPAFRSARPDHASQLFDYFVASRVFVKLSTIRSFSEVEREWMRFVVMQAGPVLDEAFRRLHAAGVRYDMDMPEGIEDEYFSLVADLTLVDL